MIDFFKIVLKSMHLFSVVFRFWNHFGKPWEPRPLPKITKNCLRRSKNRFGELFGARLFLKVGSVRVLEAFWEGFGKVSGGFRKDFGSCVLAE